MKLGGPWGTCPEDRAPRPADGAEGPDRGSQVPFPAPTSSLCFLSLLFSPLTHNKNIIMGFIKKKKRQIMVTCFNYLPSNGGLNYTGTALEVT